MINKKGIYIIKNLVNGKCYIGKTEESFKRRWWHHKSSLNGDYHSNKHLQNAWNKYGCDNFEFEVLYVAKGDENLSELEINYIKDYESFECGYNLTLGGEGTCGMTLSEEAKKAIGEKNKINMIGKKHSEETKKKMSEAHKGYVKSESHRLNLSKSLKGKDVSEETKEKCRVANQGSKQPTSKYTEELIYEIKIKLKNGCTAPQISKEYGISVGYIYAIKGNHRWSHVKVD